jgi:hypothetical protein
MVRSSFFFSFELFYLSVLRKPRLAETPEVRARLSRKALDVPGLIMQNDLAWSLIGSPCHHTRSGRDLSVSPGHGNFASPPLLRIEVVAAHPVGSVLRNALASANAFAACL